ncbi:MAG: hypothetical protein QM535_04850 [Limnohabitans sp.]|nr:hypothetical protein [Limnohabitans sp.]
MDIEKLLKEIESQVLGLLKNQVALFPKFKNDISVFIKNSQDKIKKWQGLYIEGHIDEEELEWLLNSQKNLLVLESLKNIGLSQIKANRLKNDIIKIVFQVILNSILK